MFTSPFPLSGLADEAADDIDGQISAHQALGWSAIELRLLHGRQFSSPMVSDDEFDRAYDKIGSAGMRVSSYASAIGNWSRPINGDFNTDLTDLKVLIPRMQRTHTQFVRTMSWVQGDTDLNTWRKEGVRRYKLMAKYAADGGIMLLHENCEGWGGLSGTHARQFIESIDHPNVRYLFDLGNTVSYGQDTMAFYREILPFVEYIHIKDCRRNPNGGKSNMFTYAGEGDAHVREILTELIHNRYTAGISIEPHVASIVHLGANTKADPQIRFDSYIRYGKELEKLISELLA